MRRWGMVRARYLAVVAAPAVAVGVLAAMTPAASAAAMSPAAAAAAPVAASGLAAAPASLRAAVQSTLGISASSAGFSQQAELQASDGRVFDQFGTGAAVNAAGNIAVIGAFLSGPTGAAYVFTRQGSTWTETAKLTPSDRPEFFGVSVALNAAGTTALIGAARTGGAYVFTLRGGTWSQTAQLPNPDPGQSFASLGIALDAAGTTALIPGVKGGYVFTLRGGTWSLTALLPSFTNGDSSVALSAAGTTAVIGAERINDFAGEVDVFRLQGGTWAQTAALTVSDGSDLGRSVAVDAAGTTILAGAPESGNAAAYVFTRQGGTWSQTARLTQPAGVPGGPGASVALDAAGNTALVGDPGASGTGGAYVFTRQGSTWSQTDLLLASDGAQGDQAGFLRVALSANGNTALVTARVGFVFKQGTVYVFAANGG